jgi:cell division protein FtsN
MKAVVNGRVWYRVRVSGFASADAAKSQVKSLRSQTGISDIWIGKR